MPQRPACQVLQEQWLTTNTHNLTWLRFGGACSGGAVRLDGISPGTFTQCRFASNSVRVRALRLQAQGQPAVPTCGTCRLCVRTQAGTLGGGLHIGVDDPLFKDPALESAPVQLVACEIT